MTQDNPSPEQIEQDISVTRAEIDETLAALQNKLSPGQLLDQALGYAKEGGGEFAANFGRTVRDNPLPVALLGLGVGWLMMSGRTPPQERRHHAEGTYRRQFPDPATGSRSTYEPTDSGLSGTGRAYGAKGRAATGEAGYAGGAGPKEHGLKDKISDVGSGMKRSGEAAKSRVEDKASEMADSAKERIGEASERLGEMRDDLGDRVTTARDKAGEYAGRAREGLSRARVSAGHYVHENPLVIGAAAFAAGAALGAMLPATRRESELMGEQSDSAKAAARQKVAEGARKAKTVAEAALKRGKEEALKQDDRQESRDPGTGSAAQTARTAERATDTGPGKASAAPAAPGGKSTDPTAGEQPGRAASGRTR